MHQLRNGTVRAVKEQPGRGTIDFLKEVDNALSKLMKDYAEVDENTFTQELSDASDHIMIYRKVVHLVDVKLKKTYRVPQ